MKKKSDTLVVVGMSGGVDSSVAAYLLKKEGYRVVGLFMKNWEETNEDGECTSAEDYEDVALTCAHIGIPFQGVNFVKEYYDQVFSQFVADYQKGLTPNPDVLCNKHIKFKVFFDKAMSLGAVYLATGHYCQIKDGRLLKGLDCNKDQSYFLNQIPGSVMDKVLFPVGGLEKSEVRRIAKEADLPTFAKKDSTGICFIGERNFREFISRYVQAQPGPFQTLDGQEVGTHRGAAYYTIGQRRQLGLGGPGDRWFVIKKDMKKNIVFVERGNDHPDLYADSLVASDLHWIKDNYDHELESENGFSCCCKIRYRQQDQECTVKKEGDHLLVSFKEPQRAIAPGQSIAFYKGDVCLGGAVIQE